MEKRKWKRGGKRESRERKVKAKGERREREGKISGYAGKKM